MSPQLRFVGRAITLLAPVLLVTSSAHAQSSGLGHAPARTPYPSPVTNSRVFRINPDDRMFQATMKITSYYQQVERTPVPVYRPPVRPPVREEAAPVEVSVTEPATATETVRIRGPNGEIRTFPIEGGKKAIRARTIIVRPGERLQLYIRNGQVTVRR